MHGDVVLRLRGVGKSYRGHHVLSGIDLELRAGEVTAVVGANGSGKSTLLGICAGTVRASRGLIERTSEVGFAPQQDGLADLLTVDEHLDLFGAAGGIARGRARSTGHRILDGLGWARRPQQLAGHLSGGTQQKLTVTLAQLRSPRLLLLDEPYQGFDQATDVDFWDLVEAWRGAGTGILVVTHLLRDLDRVDHVLELPSPEAVAS